MIYEIDVIDDNGKKKFECSALGDPVRFESFYIPEELIGGKIEILREGATYQQSSRISEIGIVGHMPAAFGLTGTFSDCQRPYDAVTNIQAHHFLTGDHLKLEARASYNGRNFFKSFLEKQQEKSYPQQQTGSENCHTPSP